MMMMNERDEKFPTRTGSINGSLAVLPRIDSFCPLMVVVDW